MGDELAAPSRTFSGGKHCCRLDEDKERIQHGAGRLDLLLQDPETLKRYELKYSLARPQTAELDALMRPTPASESQTPLPRQM